jgi:hypothetical protein
MPLPAEWEEFYDDEEKLNYYHNGPMGITQWERPRG